MSGSACVARFQLAQMQIDPKTEFCRGCHAGRTRESFLPFDAVAENATPEVLVAETGEPAPSVQTPSEPSGAATQIVSTCARKGCDRPVGTRGADGYCRGCCDSAKTSVRNAKGSTPTKSEVAEWLRDHPTLGWMVANKDRIVKPSRPDARTPRPAAPPSARQRAVEAMREVLAELDADEARLGAVSTAAHNAWAAALARKNAVAEALRLMGDE